MRHGKIISIMIILFVSFSPIFAFELDGVQVTAGHAMTLSAEPVADSPAPGAISPMFGVSVPMKFSSLLYFEPGLRFSVTSVILDSEYKPVPAAIETKNRISVLNCELRPEFGAVFGITEEISLGVTGAPVFSFRFPAVAHDDAADTDQKTIVRQYYFSKGRFMGFYAGGFLSWAFSEKTRLNLKLGTNLPVYHIWDGEEIPFYDGLVIEPELGIVFRF